MTQANLTPDPVLLRDICERYGVARLYLFGSALTERFGPRSDVDLLVEFQPQARIGLVAFSRLGRELASLFGRRVDLVPKNGLKAAIREEILAHAEVLYAA